MSKRRLVLLGGMLGVALMFVGAVALAAPQGAVFAEAVSADNTSALAHHGPVTGTAYFTPTADITGSLILSVTSGSPAAVAGLQSGDVILSVNGQVTNASDKTLTALVTAFKPGDKVTLQVQSSGKAARSVTVTLGENPVKPGVAYLGVQYTSGHHHGMGGPHGKALATPGAWVTAVAEASPAATAGLKANDVITALDGKTLADAQALVDAIGQKKPGDKITLTVNRMGEASPLSLAATLGNKNGKAYLGITIVSNFDGHMPFNHPQIPTTPVPSSGPQG